MRVLFSSTRGAGHFGPMIPLVDACMRAGHEVLVCGPPPLAGTVERAGYPLHPFDEPPEDELVTLWASVPSLPPREQNTVVMQDLFGRLDAEASTPGLREAIEDWSPDLVLRDPNEYGSAIAAELCDVEHARVAVTLSSVEDLGLQMVAGVVDELRCSAGLPPDPEAQLLRNSQYLTAFPASFEDPFLPEQPRTVRLRDPAWDEPAAELPDWWAGDDSPLVYMAFGGATRSEPMAAAVHRAGLEAVAGLPLRVLLTVGNAAAPDTFADAPPNVHVERCVPARDALAHASAVVCHGGSGPVIGALAAGLPLVVVPLFGDHPCNAARVEAVGAGLSVAQDPVAIRAALERVLANGSHRAAARRIAAEMRSQSPVDEALAQVLAQRVSAQPI